jgi:hypothetical protein
VVAYLVSLDQLFDEQGRLLREQIGQAEQAEVTVRMHQIRVAPDEARTATTINNETVADERLRRIHDQCMQEWTNSGKPAPLQMVSRRLARTFQGSGRMDAEESQAKQRERLNDQEVNQGEDGGENHVQPPPPPYRRPSASIGQPNSAARAIANAINRPRPHVQGMNEKLIEFLQTKPPTFGRSVNPLDADD